MVNVKLYNGMTLAYIGDAYYELLIRNLALEKGFTKVKDIHKFVTTHVNSYAQEKYIFYLINNDLLTDEETEIYKKGRNSAVKSHRKVDLQTYHNATGFEALIGYLYLNKALERIDYLLNAILGGV